MCPIPLDAAQTFRRQPRAAERRDAERFAVDIGGRYMLSAKRDVAGNRREFACRLTEISVEAFRLIVPVSGPVGERVIAYFDELGIINGQILRSTDELIVMSVMASGRQRARLAARIDWLKAHGREVAEDLRASRRIVPRHPITAITVASGETATCIVIDVSETGAAVSADLVPPVGTVVAVGAVVGRVCRHFPEGFAVTFVEPQPMGALEQRLMLR